MDGPHEPSYVDEPSEADDGKVVHRVTVECSCEGFRATATSGVSIAAARSNARKRFATHLEVPALADPEVPTQAPPRQKRRDAILVFTILVVIFGLLGVNFYLHNRSDNDTADAIVATEDDSSPSDTPPAPAPPEPTAPSAEEQQFLNRVHDGNASSFDNASDEVLLNLATRVCKGWEMDIDWEQLFGSLTDAGYDPMDATYFMAAAGEAFCPDLYNHMQESVSG